MSTPLDFKRLFDPEPVNAILNHPAIFPDISEGLEVLDISGVISDERHVIFGSHAGCIIFFQALPGIYDCHVNFLPEYRGQAAIDTGFWAERQIFNEFGAGVLMTSFEPRFTAVARYVEHMGFRPIQKIGTKMLYQLTRSEWGALWPQQQS